ncbi:DEAD-box ATP-dependent RNA helicase 22 isoform X3 [Olea europaea var. sylvestris]|uniref:DEAD-box ATP-dependent RNA helicase 22 isoform X3 n=1 Tax=Olea europaea var. sylvestris TaxID=158386 RepID=UPI000C1D26B4|nr:DEAD-box ATP-dependent RNA helicase 22 isoform X3 [Olea europaea var. sylvestris]
MMLQRSISMLSACKTSSPPKFHIPFTRNHSLLILTTWSFTTRGNSYSPNSNKFRTFGTAAAIADDRKRSDADTFFAEESVSWASLGVSDGISRALSNVGLHRPSLVQAVCIPSILSGTDVVVAAETGSGKTHGYLIPLIDKLCRMSAVSESDLDDQKLKKHRQLSLVLCPNVMLCEQVVRMANSLCGDTGEPLLRVAAICGRQGLPFKEPDIIVSTPVALLNYLYATDTEQCRRADFIHGVKYVFDEADLLLCGSFQNQVIRLINMLRFDEKQLSRTRSADSCEQDLNSDALKVTDTEDEDYPRTDSNAKEDEDTDENSNFENTETKSGFTNRKDWRRVRKIYERSKQYIFVAATLPVNGKKTAGGVLKRMFPDANWVSGNYLHCHNPRLEQRWIEVTTDSQVDALINAVNDGLNSSVDSSSGIVRTMVFANTVEAVEAVAKILMGAGVECSRFHSDVSPEERTRNLVGFQQKGGVFVCTDAASRGLDIPHVSHVIQAEFASSAVDFLHRVGRTARAGQPGLVTSLYTEANHELVSAVRQAEKLGLTMEKAFSRKRSFRNKLKKRAGFSKSSNAPSIHSGVPA